MKRRREPVELHDASGMPLALLAGRCVEVWGGPDRDAHTARRAWGDAKDRYLRSHGINPLRARDVPASLAPHAVWSFDFYRQHRPHDLPDKLADRGLPPDWTPSPAHPDDFGEPIY